MIIRHFLQVVTLYSALYTVPWRCLCYFHLPSPSPD